MKKEELINHFKALEKYNDWEKDIPILLAPDKRISMVCNLYDLIPSQFRQRGFNVDGIIKMRRALSLQKIPYER